MEYNSPRVRTPTVKPCAPTRSCIRNTLGLICPRCLNLYAPKATAAVSTPIAEKKTRYLVQKAKVIDFNQ